MKFPVPATENRFEIVAPASLSLNQPVFNFPVFNSDEEGETREGQTRNLTSRDEARHFVIGKDGEPERLTASFLSQDKGQPHCPA